MRTVSRDEIRASIYSIESGMSKSEMDDFILRLESEQPFIPVYISAISEGGVFEDEDDADIFVELATIVLHAMLNASEAAIPQVSGDDIDAWEEKVDAMLNYAAEEPEGDWPEMLQTWLEAYNQRPLIEFVLDTLMNPDSPYSASDDGVGVIFPALKVIIDSLDNA
jgi:hypothetical protein